MHNITKVLLRIVAGITIASLVMAPISYAADKNFYAGNDIIIYDPDANMCSDGTVITVTEEQKIGQILDVGFDNSSIGDLKSAVQKYQLGGVYLNIQDPSKLTKSDIDSVNSGLNSQLLIGSDDEGGQVYRMLKKGSEPSAKSLGSMSNTKVLAAGKDTGTKLTKLGLNMVLGPVLDIDTGNKNGISNYDRSFSSNPDTIATKAGAWASGVSSQDVGVVFKHFPGLGSATANTDSSYVVMSKSDINDYTKDLMPYKNSELRGTANAAVMMANYVVPGWGTDPVSINAKAVSYLRNDVGFSGLVTTDDLAVMSKSGYGSHKVSLETAIVKALKAKVDMPLFAYPGDSAMAKIISTVKASVSSTVIDSAYQNVMAYKTNLKLSTTPKTTVSGGTASTVSGNDNRTKIWNFLISTKFEGYGNQAFGPVQAAGAIGNFFQESGWRFNAVQPNQDGHGIAQWSGTRRNELYALASSMGKEWSDPEVQFQMLKNELDGSYGKQFLAAGFDKLTDPKEASLMFDKIYEQAGKPNQANRDNAAVAALKDLAGIQPTTSFDSGCSADGTTTPADMDTSQASAVAKDGFPIFLQCDDRWGSMSYSGSDMCQEGCGPTAMAMIITALTGKAILPSETAKKATEAGMTTGRGSAFGIAPTLAEMYGLKSSKISKSVDAINSVVKSGGYVFLDGRGARPFATTGHFIVIRGITSDGKWQIGNPGWSDEVDKEYSPNTVLSMVVDGSIYGITK